MEAAVTEEKTASKPRALLAIVWGSEFPKLLEIQSFGDRRTLACTPCAKSFSRKRTRV